MKVDELESLKPGTMLLVEKNEGLHEWFAYEGLSGTQVCCLDKDGEQYMFCFDQVEYSV